MQRQKEWAAAHSCDDIVREEMNGWTALVQSRAQVDATEESLRIAGENLSISTCSYSEGLATVLDVGRRVSAVLQTAVLCHAEVMGLSR